MEREGPVQKAILAWLTRWNNATIIEMACVAYGVEQRALTRNHIRSTKYAVKRLAQDGKIAESAHRTTNGEKQYSLVAGARTKRGERRPVRKSGLTIV